MIPFRIQNETNSYAHGMSTLAQEILRYVAEHESLERTCQRYPRFSREQLQGLLLSLAGATPDPVKEQEPRVEAFDEVWLFTDGASRGNPGPAGAGIWITDPKGNLLGKKAVFLGENTNNAAEYLALLIGLEEALALSPTNLKVHLDSELAVKQINGIYRVRNADLAPLHDRVQRLLSRFSNVRVVHVPREKNTAADRMANQAIDQETCKRRGRC